MLLVLKTVYRLPLRSVYGFAQSVLNLMGLSLMGLSLMGLSLPVPDFSTMIRGRQV